MSHLSYVNHSLVFLKIYNRSHLSLFNICLSSRKYLSHMTLFMNFRTCLLLYIVCLTCSNSINVSLPISICLTWSYSLSVFLPKSICLTCTYSLYVFPPISICLTWPYSLSVFLPISDCLTCTYSWTPNTCHFFSYCTVYCTVHAQFNKQSIIYLSHLSLVS